jgi:hypothetical protein
MESFSFSGRVPAGFALALLASLRDVDTPNDPEALAESHLPLNLQRRLGLSSVIGEQIRRYERRGSDPVSAAEFAGLFELISRRPDASRIFAEAGERIARHELQGRKIGARVGLRVLPQGMRQRRAWNRVRRIARELSPQARVRVEGKPRVLVIEHGLPARAAEGGVGCAVLEGAIRKVFSEYRAGDIRVVHSECEGRSEGHCAWELGTEAASANGHGAAASNGHPPEADDDDGVAVSVTVSSSAEATPAQTDPVGGG